MLKKTQILLRRLALCEFVLYCLKNIELKAMVQFLFHSYEV